MLIGRAQKGITILEIAIALAIFSILLMAGLPSFTAWLSNQRVRNVAEGILGAVMQARVESARQNQAVSFRLDSSSGGGWTVVDAAGNSLHSRPASEGGAVQAVFGADDTVTTLTFNNLGQRTLPAAANGTVWVRISNPAIDDCLDRGGSVRCLKIESQPGGRIMMCDPVRAAPDPQYCLSGNAL